MSENDDKQPVPDNDQSPETPNDASANPPARSRLRRKLKIFALSAGLLLILTILAGIVSYKTGIIDGYIKAQFVGKMDRIGINFTAEQFRVTVMPLKLELRNAVFVNKKTGEKLLELRQADLNLTISNLYAWQLSRDISIDSTEIDGVDVFVRFDENGRSNFSDLELVEEETRINFTYSSAKFSLKNGVVHFGDLQRTIAADANNILFTLAPENPDAPDDEKRYGFDLTSTGSNFVYDTSKLDNIDLRAQGIADPKGADITGLRLKTPIGESNLKGRIDDWNSPKYKLEIESTVDLTQTSAVFPIGAPLRGIGNFKGFVSGEGETYKVEGEISSESLAASNIYLKGLNINAAVNGSGAMYDANGKAVAQLLTFEDFKIDYPQAVGLIRGTGTDFKWLGDLQAAAANTPFGTIGSLFITDAVAELNDNKFAAGFGSARTNSFVAKGFEIGNVQTANGKIGLNGDETNVSFGDTKASSFKTKAFELDDVRAKSLKIRDVPRRTDLEIENITAGTARLEENEFRNLTATGSRVGYENGTTTFSARLLTATEMRANGATIGEIVAANFNVLDVPRETIVAADDLKVAKIETRAAVLGSINVAGVRLTIREGRIEGTSGDIDAGTVALVKNSDLPTGGQLDGVKIMKPVFVLEPAGTYRASADMSLGGGVVGSVKLGAAKAAVTVSNSQVELKNLTADVMDGKLNGNATIAFENRNRSQIEAAFSNLDLGKLLALQGGRVVPIDGETTGNVKLSFNGTNFKTASGEVNADIAANAGTADRGLIPVTGRVEATAANGLFDIGVARLNTERTELNATGNFDLNGYNSNLSVALASSDAREVDRIVRVLNVSPAFEKLADDYKAEFAGNLNFKGTITGNVSDPTVDGNAMLDSLILSGRELGSLKTDLAVSPTGTELKNGLLTESDGGNMAFNVNIPSGGTNNISLSATLTNINTGNVLAALPISLPDTLRGLQADTSGTLEMSGLPDAIVGEANLTAKNGSLKGETFDDLSTRVVFAGTEINLENFYAKFAEGSLTAKGIYRTDTTDFDFDLTGKDIPISRVVPFLTTSDTFPAIGGTLDLTGVAKGRGNDSRSYNFSFGGTGNDVTINGNSLGTISLGGKTENSRLTASFAASLEGQQQNVEASIDFSNENLPIRAETVFNNTELEPFIALIQKQTGSVGVTGQATGRIFFEGNLRTLNAAGEREFTTADLRGSANFTTLNFQFGDTPINSLEPVALRFNVNELVVESAKFAGGGSNVVISGTKALRDDGINNLNIDGRVNLSILNAVSPNAFFAGLADINVRLTGPNTTARLNGVAEMQNSSASAFIGTERISFERLKGRVIFTSNQAQIDNLTGFLGGGKFSASGGATINDNLQLQAFRVVLSGTNVTVPLPKNFLTTGNAEIEINGRRNGATLSSFIAGRIDAKRSLYSQNIDLADVIGGRREGSISQGGSSSTLGDVNLDLTIEGRNALVVRNNLADLTASLSLRVTGDIDAPQVEGRVTASGGTLYYRNDRYEVQRGELLFPPNSGGINPIVNLQAETEISGYQIFLKLNGPLTDTENLSAVVTSNPALPSNDVISLITTGSLSNTEGGIPTLAQSGINTAAEILTDEIINKPITKATDKLFGLNKFQLDPIISGQRNPGARLTVGRQINRNLLVTYSTNLSEDQNQVLALEYRVSNRLSFVAQYEQRSLSNVTRNRDNFSFEIRFRKRF